MPGHSPQDFWQLSFTMSVKQLVAASSPQFDSLSGHCSDGAGVIPAHFPQDFRQSAPTLEQSDLANSAQFVNLSKQSLEGAGVRPGQRPQAFRQLFFIDSTWQSVRASLAQLLNLSLQPSDTEIKLTNYFFVNFRHFPMVLKILPITCRKHFWRHVWWGHLVKMDHKKGISKSP